MFRRIILIFISISVNFNSVFSFFGLNIDLLIGNEIYQECAIALLRINEVSYASYQLSLISSQDPRIEANRIAALRLSTDLPQLISPTFQRLSSYTLDRFTNASIIAGALDDAFNVSVNFTGDLFANENSSYNQFRNFIRFEYGENLQNNFFNLSDALSNIKVNVDLIITNVKAVQDNSEFEYTPTNVISALDIANINGLITNVKKIQMSLQNIRKLLEDIAGIARSHVYIYDMIENSITDRSSAFMLRKSYLETTVNNTRSFSNTSVQSFYGRVDYNLRLFLQQFDLIYESLQLEMDLKFDLKNYTDSTLLRIFDISSLDSKIESFGNYLMSHFANDMQILLFEVSKVREIILSSFQYQNSSLSSLGCQQTYASSLINFLIEGVQRHINCIDIETQSFSNNFALINPLYDKIHNEINVVLNNMRSCLFTNNDGSELSRSLIKNCLMTVNIFYILLSMVL